MLSSSTDAQLALHTSERPYVTVENARFDPPLEQNHNSAKILFDFHNAGRTPALQRSYTVGALAGDEEAHQTPTPFPGEFVIPSDRAVTVQINVTFYKPGVFEEISTGTKRLVFKGTVKYVDIFKEWHQTKFCMAYDAMDKQWVTCPGTDVE
jgi:hypothetical protein